MLEIQSYKEIHKNIKVSTFTICTIIQNAKKSAQSKESLEIITCFSETKRSEALFKILEDNVDSIRLQSIILSEKNCIQKWIKVFKKENFNLIRSTIKNIVKNHKDFQHSYIITWTVRSAKSHLSSKDYEIRYKYSD